MATTLTIGQQNVANVLKVFSQVAASNDVLFRPGDKVILQTLAGVLNGLGSPVTPATITSLLGNFISGPLVNMEAANISAILGLLNQLSVANTNPTIGVLEAYALAVGAGITLAVGPTAPAV